MSNSRFHNTVLAFKDCLDTISEASSFTTLDLSDEENRAMLQLANHARAYLQRIEELQMQDEYEFAFSWVPHDGLPLKGE